MVDPDPHLFGIAIGCAERSYSPSTLQAFAACPYRFLYCKAFPISRAAKPRGSTQQMTRLLAARFSTRFSSSCFRKLKASSLLPMVTETRRKLSTIADPMLDRVAARFEDDWRQLSLACGKSEVEGVRTDCAGGFSK